MVNYLRGEKDQPHIHTIAPKQASTTYDHGLRELSPLQKMLQYRQRRLQVHHAISTAATD